MRRSITFTTSRSTSSGSPFSGSHSSGSHCPGSHSSGSQSCIRSNTLPWNRRAPDRHSRKRIKVKLNRCRRALRARAIRKFCHTTAGFRKYEIAACVDAQNDRCRGLHQGAARGGRVPPAPSVMANGLALAAPDASNRRTFDGSARRARAHTLRPPIEPGATVEIRCADGGAPAKAADCRQGPPRPAAGLPATGRTMRGARHSASSTECTDA